MKKIVSFILAVFFFSAECFPDNGVPIVLPANLSKKDMATELLWQQVLRLPAEERPRIVLVLGGGGARGLAHIGVLRVFQEEHIPVDEVVGVSVGALIGALYAANISVDKLEDLAGEIGWNKLTDYSKVAMVRLILAEELLSTNGMEEYLNKHIGDKFFSDLKIPFACTATDLKTGERVIFREGPVAIAARASATIPAIFRPVQYRQRYLVDGGLADNLPTDITVDPKAWNVVIAVLPKSDVKVAVEQPSIFKSLIRTIEIQKDIILENSRKSADFMIEPNVGSVGMVDLGRTEECIQAGILAARKAADNLKANIIQQVLDKQAQKAAQ